MLVSFKKNKILRLATFMKKYWFSYSIGLIGMSSTNFIFNALSATAVKNLTSASINKDSSNMVKGLVIIAISLGIAIAVLPLLGYLFEGSVKRASGEIRKKLFNHIEHLPMQYIENGHSGDIISRCTTDVVAAENAFGSHLMMLLSSIISGLGSFIMMFSLNINIAIIAFLLGLISSSVNFLFIKPIKNASSRIQSKLSSFNQIISDIYQGISVIKSFNLYVYIKDRYTRANDEIMKASMDRVRFNSLLNGINSLLSLMTFIGLIAIGSIMVIRNNLDFGTLMAEILMLNGLLYMFNSIGGFLTQFQASLSGAERIFEILDIKEEKSDDLKEYPKEYNQKVINFENVGFSYNQKEIILNNINLDSHKNEMVAIVGPSGSGKSTIFKLILGFNHGFTGHIKIFNQNIEDYNMQALRKLIGYVPQNSFLFNGTILENVSYGKEGASMEDIIEACKKANIHHFIMNLKDKYDTIIGESGNNLSGGQKQRIAIARAILKDAPILLLDEATSALDYESEYQVQKALDTLMKNRTTVVIAHRLSTIKSADKIYVLKEGNIEKGNYDELLLC